MNNFASRSLHDAWELEARGSFATGQVDYYAIRDGDVGTFADVEYAGFPGSYQPWLPTGSFATGMRRGPFDLER